MAPPVYYLGCPVWACEKWQGGLFTRHAKREDWLRQYASVFNTVEGNSTFYGLPAQDRVKRWAGSVGHDFRFVLKFPRAISHEKRLLNAESDTDAFLEVLAILDAEDCLGPSFLQLPRGFSGHHLEDLDHFLRRLPRNYAYAVEVRHQDFYDRASNEQALNQLLAELHVDRVILDSRPLFSAPPEDAFERESQSRKPRLPVHAALTGSHPVVRLIGRNDVRRVAPWIQEWSRVLAKWLHSDLVPFIFTHTPDERCAPELARNFHHELQRHADGIADMPLWPGETERGEERQLELF
jgi:uncharacterized protein YecE (DUF72 family)